MDFHLRCRRKVLKRQSGFSHCFECPSSGNARTKKWLILRWQVVWLLPICSLAWFSGCFLSCWPTVQAVTGHGCHGEPVCQKQPPAKVTEVTRSLLLPSPQCLIFTTHHHYSMWYLQGSKVTFNMMERKSLLKYIWIILSATFRGNLSADCVFKQWSEM